MVQAILGSLEAVDDQDLLGLAAVVPEAVVGLKKIS